MKFHKPSRATSVLCVVLAAFFAATIWAQQLANAKSDDETTAKLVARLVTRFHISQGEIDDAISAKMFDRYIKQLDSQKLYFTKADIEQLRKQRTQLDDQVKEGDVRFAYQTFDLYRRRVLQRVELALSLLKVKHDFTVNESLVVDGDERDWAATEEEIRERWRRRVKADILSLKLDNESMETIRDRLTKRYRGMARAVKQMERHEILELYLSSLTHAFDPHSSYMSPQTVEDFQIVMRLRLQGIGATLRSEDGYTTVVDIVEGGAAHKDGRLKKGDRIIGVDSKADGNMVDVVEMKLSKVVRLIRGKAGTKLRLKVKKAKHIEPATGKTIPGKIEVYELTRQVIQLKSAEVKGEIINTRDRIAGTSYRVGIIHIPSFYRDFEGARLGRKDFKSTSRDVRKVLDDFRAKGGVDLVIIDLRDNGGGALTEAIEVSGLFIDKGPVVQVKTLNGKPRTHDDIDPGTAYDGPLVVICDKRSASASEIFAGVIKDYKRGIIVGDRSTHGKGTVQNVMPVGQQLFRFLNPTDRGALKLTIQQFYRVNGDSTQLKGVPSDVVLPSLGDYANEGEAALDNALKFSRVPPAQYTPVNLVNTKIVDTLRQASKRRVAADPDFRNRKKLIERYLRLKNRKTISLNEAVRRKELAEAKALEKASAHKNGSEEEKDKKEIFPASYYNDEVLRIGIDYVGLLKSLKTAGR